MFDYDIERNFLIFIEKIEYFFISFFYHYILFYLFVFLLNSLNLITHSIDRKYYLIITIIVP